MYRNVVYKLNENWEGEIRLDTWDNNGNPITEIIPHESHLYYETPNGTEQSMFGTKIKRKDFKSVVDRSKWLKQNKGTKRIFECLNPVREFLIGKYAGHQQSDDFSKYELKKQFLDIEVATNGKVFPVPEKADFPVNVITMYDILLKKFVVWILPMKKYESHRNCNFKNNTRNLNLNFTKKDGIIQPTESIQVQCEYRVFEKETDLLENFAEWFNKNYPDTLTGWNLPGFDVPYLINRMEKICKFGTASLLSPVRKIIPKTQRDKIGREIHTYDIEGVSILDYQFLYKDKYNILDKKPDYKLDTISGIELGVGKLHYEGTITEFWQNEFEKFVEYNVIDVERVVQLDDKLKYIDLTRMICNFGLCEYQGIQQSSPYIYGALTLSCLEENKKIITFNVQTLNEDEGYEGAHVWPTIAGVYRRGIASFDLASLYPNIMRTLNISPETKLGRVIDDTDSDNIIFKTSTGEIKYLSQAKLNKLSEGATRGSNGVYYISPDKKEGVIPRFLSQLYNRRVEFKRLMKEAAKNGDMKLSNHYDRVQHATKIFLNSIYGQLGSKYFPMFDLDNAEAITLTGQHIIKNTGKFINQYFKHKYKSEFENVVVAGDTDSVYIRIDPIVDYVIGKGTPITEDRLQEICIETDSMEEQIDKFTAGYVKTHLFSPCDHIKFERETFCTEGAFLAKKRYVLRKMNEDGAKDKSGNYVMKEGFKYTGVEVKKSEAPDAIKDELKYIIENSLREQWSNSKYQDEILKIWNKFKDLTPDDISFWKGYNTEKKAAGFMEAAKSTGAHAKGAIFHNQLLDHLNLNGKYQKIHQGDRMRFAYVNPNNKFGTNVICWLGDWYPEFDELFEIDKIVMFDKVFLKALKRFEEINNWAKATPTKQVMVSLDDII